MNAVEFRNISKRFGSFHLDDISFDLEEGSVLGIIGENGAGKTTILKMILGFLKADEGSLKVLGCDNLRKHPEVRERIGFVMNEAGFPDALNAKNINYILKEAHKNWNEQFYSDILKRLDCEIDTNMRSLSQGNRMKLMIAASLAHEPDLLIMDEACNFLDPAARAEIINILYEYTRNEKKTLILSSHITSDLEKISDYILFLHKGKILQFAPKDEILDQYRYVHADPQIIEALDPKDVAAIRKTDFGCEAIIKTSACTSEMQIVNASLEQIFTAVTKGVI